MPREREQRVRIRKGRDLFKEGNSRDSTADAKQDLR